MKHTKLRRTLSLVLCMVMLIGMFPVSALAAENVPTEPPEAPVVESGTPVESVQPASDTPTEGDTCQHSGGASTFTEAGVCSVCGEADPDFVAPCEHSYGEDGKCTLCGEADPDYVAPHAHSYGEDGKCACGEAKPVEQSVKRTVKAAAADLSNLTRPGPVTLVYTGQPQAVWSTPTPSDGTFFWSYNVNDNGFTPLPGNYTNIGQYNVSWRLLDGDNNIVDSGSFTSYIIPPMPDSPTLGENLVYNGQPQLLATAAAGSEVSLDGKTWSSTVSATNAGTYAVHYKTTTEGISSEVGRAIVTIDRKSIDQVQYSTSKYFDGTDTLTISLPLTEDDGVVAGDDVTVKLIFTFPSADVGSYTNGVEFTSYSLTGQHNANYSASFNTNYSFPGNIKKLPITVTPQNQRSKIYLDPDPEFTYTVTSEQTIDIDGVLARCPLQGELSREAGEDAGRYSIYQGTLTNENNPNYEITYNDTFPALSIRPRVLEISGEVVKDKVYDGTYAATIDLTNASISGLPDGYNCQILETEVDAEFYYTADVGENIEVFGDLPDIKVTDPDGNDVTENFRCAYASALKGNILPVPINVSGITAIGKTYDGGTRTRIEFRNASFSGLPEGFSAEIDSLSGEFGDKNVGEDKPVTITAANFTVYDGSGNKQNSNNYQLVFPTDLTADIRTCAIITGEYEGLEKVYDGSAAASNLIIKPDNAVEGEDVSLSFDAVYQKNGADVADVGEDYTILATNFALTGADKDNYSLASFTGVKYNGGSITPRPVTVNPKATDKTWGYDDPEIDYDVTGLVDGDSLSGELSREPGETVGKYAITIGTLQTQNPNYKITLADNSFEIVRRRIEVKGVTANDKTYDGSTAAEIDITNANASYTGVTFNITEATGTFADANVGEDKKITLSFEFTVESSNPDATAECFILVHRNLLADINPMQVDVTVTGDTSKYFGQDDPEFTYSASPENDVSGTPFALTITRDVGEAAGDYAFSATNGSSNYSFSCDQSFTIKPLPITVTLESATKYYGEADPEFSYTVESDELDDDSLNTLLENYPLDIDLTRVQGEVPDEYVITATADANENPNYDIEIDDSAEATLTINQCEVELTGAVGVSKVYDGSTEATIDLSNAKLELPDGFTAVLPASIEGSLEEANVGQHSFASINLGEITILDKNDIAVTDNFNISIAAELVCTVSPRSVTLTSATASKTYDGKALVADTVTISGDGFIDGEGVDYQVTGSQTNVGSSQNTFTYALTGSTNANNYNITTEYGTLTVTNGQASITEAPKPVAGLKYNEELQALITAGTAVGGEMQYSLDGVNYSAAIPTAKNADNYTVYYKVVGDSNYSDTEVKTFTVTIAKADYDMTSAKWDYTNAFDYTGTAHTVEVSGLPSGVTVSGYSGNEETVVGNYTAKATLSYDADNYNAPVLADLNWAIVNNWNPIENIEYTVSAPNGNGWLNQDFVITAAGDYKVSLTNTADGEWKNSLTYSEETDNGSVTFYLKNETNGTISLAKTVTYKLDKTVPTGKVEFVERIGWEEFVQNITFGLFFKDEVTVKVTENDNLSGVAKIEYASSDEAKTLAEVKEIANWTEYTDSFAVTKPEAQQFVYFIRITDNAGNVTYLSTDGAVYDTKAPVISGVENGKTYYTTQKVTVTDKNIDTITFNGSPAAESITLEGNKKATYTIVVTDKAGNSTTVTVTMKPISALSAPIDNLTKDNVSSKNEGVVDDVKAAVAAIDTTNATEEEKTALKEIADKAAELEKAIDDNKSSPGKPVATLVVYDIIKGDGSSWTKGSDNNITFVVNGWFSKFVDIKVDGKYVDEANYEAKAGSTIITLKNAFLNTLADGEHTITVIYTDGKAEGTFNVHANVTSSETGDNSNIWLWFALLFVSGIGSFGITYTDRKRKAATKR